MIKSGTLMEFGMLRIVFVGQLSRKTDAARAMMTYPQYCGTVKGVARSLDVAAHREAVLILSPHFSAMTSFN